MSSRKDESIAVIGASIVLPANIHDREKFFEIVRAKNQVSVDTVAAQRYHASDIDDTDMNHPWKLRSKYSMVFTEEEVCGVVY
jgi:acyl transferase domain-containing protein